MENEIKFPCRFHRFVSVAGTIAKISEKNVKHRFGGKTFGICKSILQKLERRKTFTAYMVFQTLDHDSC